MVSSSENVGAEWTVSRCFRLLRPIVSRKSGLRHEQLAEPKKREAASQIGPPATRRKFGDSPNPHLDPDWISEKPQRTAARQYARQASGLSSDLQSQRTVGSFSIPTPIIVRLRNTEITQSQSPLRQKLEGPHGRDIFSDKFISQSDELNFRSQKLVRGALDLIETTNTCATAQAQQAFFPGSGPRSLRAMCCRRLARHVVELEDQQETQEADSKFDVATEAYSLLDETFDVGAGDYLRALTREYGIAQFEKMVLNSQIPRSHVLALLRRMRNPQRSRAKHSSEAEIESITKILLRSVTPDKPCCSRDNTYAHSFNTLAEVSNQLCLQNKTPFEFRQFDSLIQSVLPVCWFGSRRLTALWTSIFRAFMDPGRSPPERTNLIRDVSRFLEAVMSSDCALEESSTAKKRLLTGPAIPDYYGSGLGCPKCPKISAHATFMNVAPYQQTHSATGNRVCKKRLNLALNNSFSSLFTILASFAISSILHPQQLLNAEPIPIIRLLGSLSLDILLDPVTPETKDDDSVLERCTAILATTLLIKVLDRPGPHDEQAIHIRDLIEGLEVIDRRARTSVVHERSTLKLLPDLVYSVSRTSAKLLGNGGFEVLSTLAAALTSSSSLESMQYSKRIFLADLAISSTQLFAERLSSEEAWRLVTSLEESVHSQRSYYSRHTPFKATPLPRRDREGLRWEDSIGEWIEAIPGDPDPVIDSLASSRPPAMPIGKSDRSVWTPPKQRFDRNITHSDELSPDGSIASPSEPRTCETKRKDMGLSLLLLSPDTLAGSSPAPLHRSSPISRPTSLQERRPLAERTNTNQLRSSSRGGAQAKKTAGRDKVSTKRSFIEASEIESEDELLVSHVPKQPRMRTRPAVHESHDLNENVDEFESSNEDSLLVSRITQQDHRAAKRRKPRGKLLISSYTNSKGIQSQNSSRFEDTDDELGDDLF